MFRQRASFSPGLLFSVCAAALACSAPGVTDEDTVPDFVGPIPPAGAAATPTTPSTGQNPVGAVGSSNAEGINGNVPISGNSGSSNSGSNDSGSSASGAGGASNSGSMPASGSGGSATTPPSTPATGSGGSAMSAAAGAGNPPIAQPDPNNPPPNNPPVVNDPPPVDDTGSGCAPGVAFFCEDFENVAVGTAQQTATWRPEGTVSIDTQVAQGARSLHLQAAAGQNSRIQVTGFAPPNNSFFGRMNMFVEQFPTGPDNAHFVLVEATGNGGERVRPIGGQFKQGVNAVSIWGVGSDGGATGDWTDWQATAPTASGQWVCMEWHMDAANNSVDVFIDGTLKPELSVSTNAHGGAQTPFVFPTFNNLSLGWVVFQGGAVPSNYNVWLDDIVLSSERVGCP
jgi:hypothetical protein